MNLIHQYLYYNSNQITNFKILHQITIPINKTIIINNQTSHFSKQQTKFIKQPNNIHNTMLIPQPIKTAIHYILSIVVINQLTSFIDKQGELLLNQSYTQLSHNNERNVSGNNDNQVFMSVAGGLMVQKAMIFAVSWVVLAFIKAFMNQQSKNQERTHFMARNNLNDHIDQDRTQGKTGNQEIYMDSSARTAQSSLVQILTHPFTLALLWVISTLTISSLQKSLNIIILNTSKNVCMFSLLLLVSGLFSPAPCPKLQLFITLLLLTSVSVIDLKTDLLDLYIASWNRRIIPELSYVLDLKLWIPFSKMMICRFMEVAVWIAVYYILNFKKNRQPSSKSEEKNQWNPRKLMTSAIQILKLLTQISKYCFLLLLLYTIFTSQFLYTFRFLSHNPTLIPPLITLSTSNLLTTILSYHLLTHYPIHITFSIIASKSLLPHASHYMLSYIQPLSIPFYIAFAAVAVQLVSMLQGEQFHDDHFSKQLQMKTHRNIKKTINNVADFQFVPQGNISIQQQQQVNGILASQQHIQPQPK